MRSRGKKILQNMQLQTIYLLTGHCTILNAKFKNSPFGLEMI